MNLVDRARELVPTLAAQSPAIEAARRVLPEVSAAMGAAGLYRMLAPAAVGGEEADPATFLATLETLATGDSAAAWTVMTGATTGLLLHYLDPDAARTILEETQDASLAGVFAPTGSARPTDDGAYSLTGRWAWASGCENAIWRMGGAVVPKGEDLDRLSNGAPAVRSCFFRAEASTVHDTWHTHGMRGTGSHDVEVREISVPEAFTTCVFRDAPRHDAAVARFPVFGLLALGVSAVGLGIARSALDELVEVANAKRAPGGGRRLAESELLQVRLATSEGHLAAARALVREAVDEAWTRALGGDALTEAHRAKLRLGATMAAKASVSAVETAYELAGGTAVWEKSPLQRHLRDVRVMAQHIMVGERTLKPVGRVMLGLPTDITVL
ncbi:MAG: acyl-CoA dehydrogenase family protein [Myxococcota bacterium]